MSILRNPPSRQRGIAASKVLMIIVAIVLLALAYRYVKDRNFFGLSTASITSPIKNINPFTDDYAGFGVQVVATTSLAEGKKVMNKFATDGYSAFIVETDQRGSPLYLVRLGPYSRDEATAINDKIKRRYKRSPYVRDSFVVYREG
ncbi:SPOR domain-containing protein [Leucothrix arctica]|uniref:SPOR domain-containing protein n=1 Tax=Leucothrix arctica TaxID=1481894 RepID=A0A317C7C1_9GAMM|nr:SPOR domain-containing protein [Leucothrix arctica]PWQ94536.1 hypothetical protein DKT75_14665 [Leucothrix arctica]